MLSNNRETRYVMDIMMNGMVYVPIAIMVTLFDIYTTSADIIITVGFLFRVCCCYLRAALITVVLIVYHHAATTTIIVIIIVIGKRFR